MSATIQDGGSAFPQPTASLLGLRNTGMTLRDWFAGQALPGLLAHEQQDYAPLDSKALKSVPESAYKIADAMLAAREPQEEAAQ